MDSSGSDLTPSNSASQMASPLSLCGLAAELTHMVLEMVEPSSLKALQFTCRHLRHASAPVFYRTFFSERYHVASAHSIQALRDITGDSNIRHYVKVIKIGARRFRPVKMRRPSGHFRHRFLDDQAQIDTRTEQEKLQPLFMEENFLRELTAVFTNLKRRGPNAPQITIGTFDDLHSEREGYGSAKLLAGWEDRLPKMTTSTASYLLALAAAARAAKVGYEGVAVDYAGKFLSEMAFKQPVKPPSLYYNCQLPETALRIVLKPNSRGTPSKNFCLRKLDDSEGHPVEGPKPTIRYSAGNNALRLSNVPVTYQSPDFGRFMFYSTLELHPSIFSKKGRAEPLRLKSLHLTECRITAQDLVAFLSSQRDSLKEVVFVNVVLEGQSLVGVCECIKTKIHLEERALTETTLDSKKVYAVSVSGRFSASSALLSFLIMVLPDHEDWQRSRTCLAFLFCQRSGSHTLHTSL